jgi:hypothetical protein
MVDIFWRYGPFIGHYANREQGFPASWRVADGEWRMADGSQGLRWQPGLAAKDVTNPKTCT